MLLGSPSFFSAHSVVGAHALEQAVVADRQKGGGGGALVCVMVHGVDTCVVAFTSQASFLKCEDEAMQVKLSNSRNSMCARLIVGGMLCSNQELQNRSAKSR